MTNISKQIFLLIVLSTVTQALEFTEYTLLTNINQFDKAIFSDNHSFVIFYNNRSNTALVHTAFDWKNVNDSQLTNFDYPPDNIETIISKKDYIFVYFNDEVGQLRQKTITNNSTI